MLIDTKNDLLAEIRRYTSTLALGIEPQLRDGCVCFTLSEPAKLTVEYNGQVQGALHLFVDPPEENKPDENTPQVRYYGPGIYKDVIITPRSNETIYLDEGCVLYGQIFCGLGKNFTIAGHGVLCGSIHDHYEDNLAPSAWTVNLLNCRHVTFENTVVGDVQMGEGDGTPYLDLPA